MSNSGYLLYYVDIKFSIIILRSVFLFQLLC